MGDVLSTVRAAVNVDAVPVFLDEENDVVSGSTKFCLVADQRWSLRWGDAVVSNTALSVAVGSGKSASVLGGDALVAALRAQFESTAARLSTLTAELTSTESTVKDMQNILDVAKESARRRIRNLSILAGAGMAAQWGVIYYLVYSVRALS